MREKLSGEKQKGYIVLLIILSVILVIAKGVSFYRDYEERVTANGESTYQVAIHKQGVGNVIVTSDSGQSFSENDGFIEFPCGENVRLEIKAATNYRIHSIKINDEERVGFSNREIYEEDIFYDSGCNTIEVFFEEYYELNLECSGKAAVLVNEERYSSEEDLAGLSLEKNGRLELSIIPEKYCSIVSIELDGQTIEGEELDNYLDEEGVFFFCDDNIEKQHSIFVKLDKVHYQLNCNIGEGGTVLIDGEKVEGVVSLEAGTYHKVKVSTDNAFYYIDKIKSNDEILYENDRKTYGEQEKELEINEVVSDIEFDVHISKIRMTDSKGFSTMVNMVYDSDKLSQKKEKSNCTEYIFYNVDGNSVHYECKKDIFKLYYLSEDKKTLVDGNQRIDTTAVINGFLLIDQYDGCSFGYETSIKFTYDDKEPIVEEYKINYEEKNIANGYDMNICIRATDIGDAGVKYIAMGKLDEYYHKIENPVYISNDNVKNQYFTINIDQSTLKNEEYFLWAADHANNISKPIPIDLTPPTISASAMSSWSVDSASVQGVAKDATSKVTSVYYSLDKSDFTNHLEDKLDSTKPSIKKACFQPATGDFIFDIESEKSKAAICYIWAFDSVGNRSIEPTEVMLNFDAQKPEISLVSKTPNDNWTNEVVAMKVRAEDCGEIQSGLKEVYYATNRQGADPIYIDMAALEDGTFTVLSPTDEGGNPVAWSGNYYFWAKDQAGNLSEPLKVKVNVDVQAPSIKTVELYEMKEDELLEITEGYTHGIYGNHPIRLCFTVEDKGYSSGINQLTLLKDGIPMEAKNVDEEGKVKFDLTIPFQGSISVIGEDKVGNMSKEIRLDEVKPSLLSNKIVLETEAPDISIETEKENYCNQVGEKWYNKDVAFKVICSEKLSGISSVKIMLNDVLLEKDSLDNDIEEHISSAGIFERNYQINTTLAEPSVNGAYVITVQVQDFSGNKYEKSATVFVDDKKPNIEGFRFEESVENSNALTLEKESFYESFFTSRGKIIIEGKDELASSGVESIVYQFVDCSDNKQGEKGEEIAKRVDDQNQIVITTPANFKGYLLAKVIDNTGNISDTYKKSIGFVVETKEHHNENASITLSVPDTTKKDKEGNLLYEKEVPIILTAKDEYTGIKKVEWSVTAPYDVEKNYSNYVIFDSEGKSSEENCEVHVTKTDKNLITQIEHNLVVKNNSNLIQIVAKMTDNAGYVTEHQMTISIDETAPVIEIRFDKDSADNHGGLEYFHEPRNAILSVKERNFDPELVNIIVDTKYGLTPVISKWSECTDPENPDSNVYTATLTFSVDGEYTLEVQAEDLAGNQGNGQSTHTFCIDQTKPVITVQLMNQKKENDYFYNQDQVALITIFEKNYSDDLLQITGTSELQGNEINYPVIENVSSFGDTHVVRIVYKENGNYTLQVSCMDQAGNQAEEMASINFVVDQQKPLIQVEGIEDSAAYNGVIIPSISYTDTNIDESSVEIRLEAANRGEVELAGQYEEIVNGKRVTFDCFPVEQNVDDLYTLKICANDLAGNETIKELHFSVNRFGSVYTFGDDLKAMAGGYVQEERDVIICESNVNGLAREAIQLKVIFNGAPINLEEGEDYSVDVLSGGNKWSQYEYRIKKQVFREEGTYIVTVYSVDDAGNVNENIDENKKAEIWFGVDRTKPVITAVDLNSGKTYAKEYKNASLVISDNLVLGSVEILLNGEKVDYTVEKERYSFLIPCCNTAQNVKVIAKDAAGNHSERKIEDFYVTTDLTVRIVNNKPLLIGTFGGAGLIMCGMLCFIRRRKIHLNKQ